MYNTKCTWSVCAFLLSYILSLFYMLFSGRKRKKEKLFYLKKS